MRTSTFVSGVLAAVLLGAPAMAQADEAASAIDARIARALATAWSDDTPAAAATAPAPAALAVQGRAARSGAGPNIGTVGIGAVGGLTELEIGPSFRFWATDRIGIQAHLGFSGDELGPDDVDYIRFEPTVIVAIGDFGEGAVNVRPYVGGGLRVIRTDIGPFDDSHVKPVGVGGVEFGFSCVPRLKASAELSLSPDIDPEDFDLDRRGPKFGGARVAALVHYFF